MLTYRLTGTTAISGSTATSPASLSAPPQTSGAKIFAHPGAPRNGAALLTFWRVANSEEAALLQFPAVTMVPVERPKRSTTFRSSGESPPPNVVAGTSTPGSLGPDRPTTDYRVSNWQGQRCPFLHPSDKGRANHSYTRQRHPQLDG